MPKDSVIKSAKEVAKEAAENARIAKETKLKNTYESALAAIRANCLQAIELFSQGNFTIEITLGKDPHMEALSEVIEEFRAKDYRFVIVEKSGDKGPDFFLRMSISHLK